MVNNRKNLIVMIILGLVILSACGNSSEELIAKSNSKASHNSLTQKGDGGPTNKSLTDPDENKTESSSTYLNDQENTSYKASTNSNDNRKNNYLNKLNV